MENLTPEIVKNKRVLMRVDFNVDIDQSGQIIDDFRIVRTLPTIQFLQEKGAEKIILISHLGQPEKENFWTEKFTLKPIVDYLEQALKNKIHFCALQDLLAIKKIINASEKGAIWLLENIRYHEGEEKNDRDFASELAQLGDLYINEAFSVSHREAASLCAITKFLPSYPGFLLEDEIKHLNNIINPKPPLVIILGGAKVEDKLPLIENFSLKADWILIGGVIANTILKSWNFEIGNSLSEEKMIKKAKNLSSKTAELILPGDFLVLTKNQQRKNRGLGQVEKGDNILDIGPIAAFTFRDIIQKAQTIFWNGPMGKIEDKRFRDGTKQILEGIIHNKKAKVVIGGGDTIKSLQILKPEYPPALLRKAKRAGKFQVPDSIFLSTGGGAMMNYLAGKPMPGLITLN